MFGFALALSVPVASKGPATVSAELAAFVHVDPATVPVIPVAAVLVMVPLLVTVTAPLIAIVPGNDRFAVAWTVLPPVLIVTVPVSVIDPVPSIWVPLPFKVIGPVPDSVPFTTKLPVIGWVNVLVLNVAPLPMFKLPATVTAPPAVVVWLPAVDLVKLPPR